jgi:hypothetical protein
MNRESFAIHQLAALIDKIQRRQANDPDLPPMPLNFQEIEKRRREQNGEGSGSVGGGS